MQHPLDFAMQSLGLALLAGSAIVWAGALRKILYREPLAPYEPRAQVPWTGFHLIVLLVVLVAFDVLLTLLLRRMGDIKPGVLSTASVVGQIISHLAWLIFAVVYLSRQAGAYADDMGFDTRQLAGDLRLAGLAFLAAFLPVYGTQYFVTQVLGYESKHPLTTLVQSEPSVGVLVVTTLAAVGVAPLIEEFFLRVLLQGWLEKKHIEWRERRGGSADEPAGFWPIVISAALFASLHGGPDPLALFVLALLLGYVYQRTHRIIAPLAVHICVNSLAMLELWRAFLTGTH